MTQQLATFNEILFTKGIFSVQNAPKSHLFSPEAPPLTLLG